MTEDPELPAFAFTLLPSAAFLLLPGSAPGPILMESCKLHAKPVIHKYFLKIQLVKLK